MLTSNDYKELAARCTELASESSEPTVAEALMALASDYLARAAKLHHQIARAAVAATTTTETARPMVPSGLDGERQLLRTGLRQGPGCYLQERLVSGRLAGERQLLHPVTVSNWEHSSITGICK
jgi:hypothetical protein